MEREVILEALPGSKVGQAAELNRGQKFDSRSPSPSAQCGPALVGH